MFSLLCVFLQSLTEVIPGAQDDDNSVLALHGLLHDLFIQHVSHHHPGRLVVSRQPGRVAHQHCDVVSCT